MTAQTIETMSPVMRGKALQEVPLPTTEEDGQLFFNALLYPNRSLPNKGFIAIMSIVVGVNLFSSIFYFFLGAWPVIFFAGLDILLVWVAFKLSYRQGRLHERIFMTQDDLWVCRVLPSSHESRWRLQPYWTQIAMARPAQHESQLKLISHGKTLIVGAFLSPEERADLADALEMALKRAKSPPKD